MNYFVIVLIFVMVVFVYLRINFKNINVQNKLIKIICKVSINKDNHVLIIKIMEKYYLCSSSQNEFKIIENLDEEKVATYIETKKNILLEKR